MDGLLYCDDCGVVRSYYPRTAEKKCPVCGSEKRSPLQPAPDYD